MTNLAKIFTGLLHILCMLGYSELEHWSWTLTWSVYCLLFHPPKWLATLMNLKTLEGWSCTYLPDVHETKTSDVWRVRVRQETVQLFPCQLQRVQLVKKAVGRWDDASCTNTTDLIDEEVVINRRMFKGFEYFCTTQNTNVHSFFIKLYTVERLLW